MIVCNSGPLIALGGIDRLELLRDLFGQVVVPTEVVDEWQKGGIQKTGFAALKRASWIESRSIPTLIDPLLVSILDLGGARAIELARQLQPAVLLMDEARGRRVARDIYGLQVIGTGRVLIEAKRAGLIAQVEPLVSGMRQFDYWFSDKIVAEILRRAGE